MNPDNDRRLQEAIEQAAQDPRQLDIYACIAEAEKDGFDQRLKGRKLTVQQIVRQQLRKKRAQ